MASIRQPGKINGNTILIDTRLDGIAGAAAVYLIEGEKKCLIDGGARSEAPRLVRTLRDLNSFPPDIIIATHAHYDHVQGIPFLIKQAARERKRIQVMASEKTIRLLDDPFYNKVFNQGPLEKIEAIIPLKEGDTVDLGGTTLRICEVPGHCDDHIAILDENNKNLFLGDAIGDNIHDHVFLPAFMPPSCNPAAFIASIEKLSKIDYDSVCLSHFGYIYGDEAQSILDKAVLTWNTWWQLFEENSERLNDIDYLSSVVLKNTGLRIPEIQIVSLKTKALIGMLNVWNKLMRGKRQSVGELLLREILERLSKGYKTCTGR